MLDNYIYDFIKPHLGEILFWGDASIDYERIKNIDKYENLLFCLLEDLESSYSSCQGRSEKSAKDMQKRLDELIQNITSFYKNSYLVD